ncbi:MAG: hypothetical protein HC898_12925 [Phycisphaerales bacterium]|nr:hypothetical protein [Phycisphaerales bacterium]
MGSYFLLGEIITTLPLASAQDLGITHSDHCGSCTRCIEACPTQCLEPYRIDASRCISYLTIEHRDTIDPGLHPLMGDWLAGCDVCQEVCPFNDRADRPGTMHPKYQRNTPGNSLPVLEVLGWDEAARQKTLVNSALKRIKLDQFKRNALIVAGNLLSRDLEPAADIQIPLLDRIRTIARDVNESEMVRVTAAQVLERSVNPRRPA